MRNSLISVIVPIYNVEPYLRQCVDSILAQTYTSFEMILVDDGSPDNCPRICDEYAAKDNRIKVIHKINGGLSDARNAGVAYSQGEYIVFIDSDDEVESAFLHDLAEAMQRSSAQIAVCGVKYVYLDENPARIVEKTAKAECGLSASELFLLIEDARIFNPAWNKLYDASLIKKHGIKFADYLVEDVNFNMDYFAYVDSIAVVESALYRYNKRNIETLVTKYYPNLLQCMIGINARRRRLFEQFSLDSEESRVLLANLCSGYIGASILNLYKKNNKENLKSRLTVFRNICADAQISKDVKLFVPRNAIEKLLKRMMKIGSPCLMFLVYSFLFSLRNRFSGVYMKVRRNFI